MGIRRALISVFDKAGVVDLARQLRALDVELLSTGGTARLLGEHGIPVVEVAEYTGFPEIMGGRVKTLHPRIHGALLGRRGQDETVMTTHDIRPIDLLVVNLYPFEQVTAEPGCDEHRAVEHIDVGGPAMLRAAAKNFASVTVVVSPADYGPLLDALQAGGGEVPEAMRRRWAAKAFALSARYDGAIADYLSATDGAAAQRLPARLSLRLEKAQDMRYGENPHQRGAFYVEAGAPSGSIAAARQVQGKALSYNNVADADAALECVKSFAGPACVIVKHANPCGVAAAADSLMAYERAFRTDPTSAFGGIIALNRPLDGETAEAILGRQFVEVIVAPEIAEDARGALSRKPSVRVLACGPWQDGAGIEGLDYKRVTGGFLAQDRDQGMVSAAQLQTVTKRRPSEDEVSDLLFAWQVVKFVKSNAIVFAKEQMTVGIGAGQMSRVESVMIATRKAQECGLINTGGVMASDAFFPFRDGIDTAASAGIEAVIQPGGSVRDEEVIEAANAHGMAMVFTGMRHFRH